MAVKVNKAVKNKNDIPAAFDIESARREWDKRTGKYLNSLKMWQILAILSISGLMISLYYMGKYIQSPRLLPYVVLEKQDGSVTFQGMLTAQKLTINDAVVQNYLSRFITDLRSISSDVVVLKNNLADLYTIASPNAQRQLTEYINTSKPWLKSAQEIHVDIRFTLFQHVTDKTWLVQWIEEVRDKGMLKESKALSGSFTYTQDIIQTEMQAVKNPTGLFFTEYYITEQRTN